MKRMTRAELKDYLFNCTGGAKFIGFTAATPVRMRKTGNPWYNKVLKVNTFNARVNCDYETGVNTRREKEGKEPDFIAGSNWHIPVMNGNKYTPLAKHKDRDEYYLRYFPERSGTPSFIDKDTQGIIDRSKFGQFEYPPSEYTNQGLAEPNEIKVVKLDNLRSIRIDGEEIEIIG